MRLVKIVVLLCSIMCLQILPVKAESEYEEFLGVELPVEQMTVHQQEIMKTGFRLLNANLYEKRITFYFLDSEKTKIKVNDRNKTVSIPKGVLPYVDNEDELAAVLGVAIAHISDVQGGFFRRFSISFSPRKYETKADKKAVDIMVKAGYNPIGLINIITKTAKENSWFEYNIFRHNGSERLVDVYQYIYEKYPVYLADNEYLTNYAYQNFLRTTKKERKKIRILQQHRVDSSKNKEML